VGKKPCMLHHRVLAFRNIGPSCSDPRQQKAIYSTGFPVSGVWISDFAKFAGEMQKCWRQQYPSLPTLSCRLIIPRFSRDPRIHPPFRTPKIGTHDQVIYCATSLPSAIVSESRMEWCERDVAGLMTGWDGPLLEESRT
jgi:hypothetical protein